MRILLVEDEFKLANAIRRSLELQKYAVDLANDAETAWNLLNSEENYDLIISDLMLPGMDGIQFCQEVRQSNIQIPILILTAKGQIHDRVSGLDSGADDYMLKPFSFEELFARVRALTRRSYDQRSPKLTIEDLVLDPANFKISRAGKNIELSSREFSLLEYLLRNKNKILSKEQIISHVWDYDADILLGTVEVHIKHLRDKVDKPFNKKLIRTIRGFGYKLTNED